MHCLTIVVGSSVAAGCFLASPAAHGQCAPPEVAHLLALDARAADLLGFSVAIDGDTAIVGAMGHDTVPGPIARQGAAYIFVRSGRGDGWTQQAKLTASDGIAGDNFGIAVALDGDIAVVGAYAPVGFRPGSAYVFARSSGVWTEAGRLTASDGVLFDYFGVEVAVLGDSVVVGASKADVAGQIDAGAAYIFERGGSHWNQQARLVASDPEPEDHFGASVAIDGSTLAVGAPDDNHPAGLQGAHDAGSAYIFVRAGGQWQEQAILPSPQPRFVGTFGSAVALRGDTLLVGEPSPLGPGPGAAYIFERSAGAWTARARLEPSDGAAHDDFGGSIAFDGHSAVLGAARHDGAAGANSGAAYLFQPVAGGWMQRAKLTASDASPGDLFGTAVRIDQGVLLAGAWADDTAAGTDAGSAYLFELTCGGCYANCDGSTTAPALNVADFTCFLQRFGAGDSYANCDGSTAAPVLNVGDFTCFLQAFAAGCP